MRHQPRLTAALAAALLCATISVAVPLEGLRIAAGLPLCLLLPGYALAAAIFARNSMHPAPMLLLGVALSLSTLVIGSLFLDATPWGLRTGTWAGWLVGVTLAGCILAARRRRRSPPVRRRRTATRIRPADGALLVGAAVAAIAAVTVAWTPFPAKDVAGYTRLWVLPLDRPGAAGVRVGVGSEEQDTTAYQLELRIGGKGAPILSDIVLAPGQERILNVRVQEPLAGTSLPVTARLYVPGRSEPYRRARSWISGT